MAAAPGRCGQISLGEGDEIRPLRTMQFPDSLGWFYSRITALLGLRPHWDEHKVQWLGRQGQPEYLPVFRKLFRTDAHGLPVLDRRYFAAGSDERGTFSPQFFREMKINKEKLRGDSALCKPRSPAARSFFWKNLCSTSRIASRRRPARIRSVSPAAFF